MSLVLRTTCAGVAAHRAARVDPLTALRHE